MREFSSQELDVAIIYVYDKYRATIDKEILVAIVQRTLSYYQEGYDFKEARSYALKLHLRQYEDVGGLLFSAYSAAIGKLLGKSQRKPYKHNITNSVPRKREPYTSDFFDDL